jgi:ATP-binding cassette subfamily B protein
MTHDLIERMLGYRTQLAQQHADDWHRGEDESLERYVAASGLMDRSQVRVAALVPRGWLLLALVCMSPALVLVTAPTTLAVTVGGILLAYRGFKRLTISIASLVGAEIAWRQIAEVFHAAARSHVTPFRRLAGSGSPILQVDGVGFRHAERSNAVLDACSLAVAARDRIVLRGPSGGGKSTFAAICAGLRAPGSGLMLLHGLDRHTVGFDEWRRRIVLVPQFHENHVLLGTFGFNLLLGVQWPPRPGDLARAEQLCRDLGLGDLIDRMPGGLMQMVGETGWQLSHGERSRLFLARALLQQPDLLILDETFAQLDPVTIQRALDTVIQRQPTVLLIAHA